MTIYNPHRGRRVETIATMPDPAPPKPASNSDAADADATEESTLVNALTLLHQMHHKLTLLRESIPHMVQPIMKAGSYPTPEALFDDFSKRTLKASEELVEFTSLVSDEKWVFEKALASRKDGGMTVAESGEVRRWKSSAPVPAYLKQALDEAAAARAGAKAKTDDEKEKEKKRKAAVAEAGKEREVPIDEVVGVESEDARRAIVEEFRTAHPEIEVTFEDGGKSLKVVLPKAVNLTFTIEFPTPSSEASNRYIVTLPVPPYLHLLILRSVTTRPNAGSLKYLLDMLATYTSIYKTKCRKCAHLTHGPKADLPTVRRLRKTIKLVRKDKQNNAADGSADGGDKMDTSSDSAPKTQIIKEEKSDGDSGEEDAEVEVVEEQWVAYHEGMTRDISKEEDEERRTTELCNDVLVSGTGARPAKLLRLTPPVVRHQQRPVVLQQRGLELVLRVLVHVLLVIRDNALGDRLADGVDLRRVATARYADADVDVGELVEAEDEQGLVDLEAEDFRLDEVDWGPVDL
ncbi:hypothetical protein Dda_2166 [Drechslerella dactyloides]|uniref:Uncharacterized protein n=1 Tax=Drechslerella dactyloides TaxID=74499 RepID=A0AAD6J367_DREDA|nr:hypothetical protein Dda_2166 [Drechslerella dactyloides]